jgi:hypothetical protein
MKRAHIQWNEEVYELLRRRIFKEKRSIAGVPREMMSKEMNPPARTRSASIKDSSCGTSFDFAAGKRQKKGVGAGTCVRAWFRVNPSWFFVPR